MRGVGGNDNSPLLMGVGGGRDRSVLLMGVGGNTDDCTSLTGVSGGNSGRGGEEGTVGLSKGSAIARGSDRRDGIVGGDTDEYSSEDKAFMAGVDM